MGNLKPHIERHYDDLHSVIRECFSEAGASSYIDLLHELWNAWADSCITDGEGDTDSVYQISCRQLDNTHTVMRLMYFIAAMGEKWAIVKRLEEQQGQEEVKL